MLNEQTCASRQSSLKASRLVWTWKLFPKGFLSTFIIHGARHFPLNPSFYAKPISHLSALKILLEIYRE